MLFDTDIVMWVLRGNAKAARVIDKFDFTLEFKVPVEGKLQEQQLKFGANRMVIRTVPGSESRYLIAEWWRSAGPERMNGFREKGR